MHVHEYVLNISYVYHLQSEFPKSKEVLHPGWVYAIVVILAGVPSAVIPGYAIYKAIRNCFTKDDDQREIINATSLASINGDTKKL